MSRPRELATAVVTAAFAGAIGALALVSTEPTVAARVTARVAFGAFVIAFAIAPRSRPEGDTPGALERHAWAAFIAAHVVHLAYLANNVLQQTDHPPLWRAGGGMLAYAVLGVVGLALLATRAGARTPRLRWLIDAGGTWVAIVFLVSYAGRALATPVSPGYLILFAFAVAAPVAHWAIVLRARTTS